MAISNFQQNALDEPHERLLSTAMRHARLWRVCGVSDEFPIDGLLGLFPFFRPVCEGKTATWLKSTRNRV